MLYDVVVTRPFDKVFTYSSTNEQLEIGQIVLVPFGKKMEAGINCSISGISAVSIKNFIVCCIPYTSYLES